MFRNANFFCALAIFVLAGCRRDEVKVYRIPKDDSAAPRRQIAAPEQNFAVQPQPASLQFILPDGWRQIAPSELRAASFIVTNANGQTADVGVIPLPTGEDELALVNLWREQMQLPALTNETSTEPISVGDDSAKFFDIASDAPLIDGKFRARILVAELPRGATSWFFKMTGEDSFVASQKESFLKFLKSVSFAENVPAQIAPASEAQNSNGNSIWTIPPGWKQIDPGTMLLAKFSISAGDENADVNVSELAGEGGGLEANVNRWRGQLGLQPIAEILTSGLSAKDTSGAEVVDFAGTDSKTGKPARLIGAIVPQNGQTWFYKLMGDPEIVARQKDAFIQFIQSANYANARNTP